jgi:oligopeptide/dipeptide ABC transporter ATP-binding protein
MVFQSAMNALNPVMRVGDQFLDMTRAHRRVSKSEALARAGDLLELVGLERRRLRAYPHELSGGMRQRVIIAMALALQPELVVLDEPTTALDVVVQREILHRVQEIQRELGFSVLFITHDLSLLLEVADRIAIMYAGEIVEWAAAAQLAKRARHPYTQGLLESFPPLRGPLTRLTGIPGAPPDLANPPAGCRFTRAARTASRRTPGCMRARRRSVRCSSSSIRATRSRVISSPRDRRERDRRGTRPHEALSARRCASRSFVRPRGRRCLVRAPAGDDHGSRRRER